MNAAALLWILPAGSALYVLLAAMIVASREPGQRGAAQWVMLLIATWLVGGVIEMGAAAEAARQLDFVADPTSQYPLRVTQREVMALNIFGYIGEEQNGSMCFTLPEKNKPIAEGATLTTYAAEVKALVTALDPSKA